MYYELRIMQQAQPRFCSLIEALEVFVLICENQWQKSVRLL